jgi:hypothetical protein
MLLVALLEEVLFRKAGSGVGHFDFIVSMAIHTKYLPLNELHRYIFTDFYLSSKSNTRG